MGGRHWLGVKANAIDNLAGVFERKLACLEGATPSAIGCPMCVGGARSGACVLQGGVCWYRLDGVGQTRERGGGYRNLENNKYVEDEHCGIEVEERKDGRTNSTVTLAVLFDFHNG